MPHDEDEHLSPYLGAIDADGAWLFATEEFADLVGYELPTLLATPPAALFVEGYDHDGLLARIAERGQATEVVTLVAQDGTLVEYVFTARVANGGDVFVAAGRPLPLPAPTPEPLAPGDSWLTKLAAVDHSHLSRSTIDRGVSAGELPRYGPPGRAVFKRSDVDAWVARRRSR